MLLTHPSFDQVGKNIASGTFKSIHSQAHDTSVRDFKAGPLVWDQQLLVRTSSFFTNEYLNFS